MKKEAPPLTIFVFEWFGMYLNWLSLGLGKLSRCNMLKKTWWSTSLDYIFLSWVALYRTTWQMQWRNISIENLERMFSKVKDVAHNAFYVSLESKSKTKKKVENKANEKEGPSFLLFFWIIRNVFRVRACEFI